MTKTANREDVDPDKIESRRKIAKNFAIKPSDLKLPKMGLQELQDPAIDFRDGYQLLPHVLVGAASV